MLILTQQPHANTCSLQLECQKEETNKLEVECFSDVSLYTLLRFVNKIEHQMKKSKPVIDLYDVLGDKQHNRDKDLKSFWG
jgi:hypothetical protein